ncbi:hypothetical protein EMCRGX_G000002 [Ephydatia muelleri]
MPSRNQKKRSKQRAEYLQKREDILSQENKAKARARYKADPEKKKASVRTRHLQGRPRKEEGLCTYSLFEPNSRTLAEYGVRLEKAILRYSELLSEVNNAFCNSHPLLAQKVVTRSARAAVSKISADALLAKALSVRRSQAGSLLKTIRKVNAKKLQESDILVGHRFHTAGAEPYFFDNSKSVEENRAAKRQRYQEDVEDNRAAKRQRYQEDVEENRTAKRQKYEDNSAAIKASERNRYWNDPAVRLAKRAAEGKRYRRGHRTTTTTQRCSAAPLPSAASSSSAAPTTSSSSAAHTASSRSTATVLAPVPPPPHCLLPPWPCHHPPAWLPWPEPGCRVVVEF